MNNIEHEDRATFTRTMTVEYEGDECPEYVDRFARLQHKGLVSKVRLRYTYQFRSGEWSGDAVVYWRWLLKSGDLGKDERQDTFSRAGWVQSLIEQHLPTSTIEIKESAA